jgi:hypothetical protein
MGGRGEAPLRRLLHIGPLVVQVHGERVGVALAVLEDRLPRDDEAHPRNALDAFSGGRDDRVDGVFRDVDVDRA